MNLPGSHFSRWPRMPFPPSTSSRQAGDDLVVSVEQRNSTMEIGHEHDVAGDVDVGGKQKAL